MISSRLGKVELSSFTSSEDAFKLGLGKESLRMLEKVALRADLACILEALADEYGVEEAFEMWTEAAELVAEGDKNE